MPKFFTARENISKDKLIIDSEDAKHIKKVLRLGIGDEIMVCDGRGFDYTATISTMDTNKILCDISQVKACHAEPKVAVTLYQGIPKASKMDYIIQKTTELGINRIVPAKLARCVVKFENAAAEQKKTERWQKISYEAAKQSGRGIIPKVSSPKSLDEVINELSDYDLVFVPYECESKTHLYDITENIDNIKSAAFIIGPEGGFDPSEIEKLYAAGIKTITLGRRILRTETAGEAVLAMLMYALKEI